VGPRAGLDTEARGKILSPLPAIEPRSPGRPARSRTLYWLSDPGLSVCLSPSSITDINIVDNAITEYFRGARYGRLALETYLGILQLAVTDNTHRDIVYITITAYGVVSHKVSHTLRPLLIYCTSPYEF
jgi:hypothetical protein